MDMYTVRIWNNGDDLDNGSLGEFEMTDDSAAEGQDDVIVADMPTIQLRLLEAININLASIAESLEKVRR